MKKFTITELHDFNGQAGKPVYVAYNGKVYDVSASFLWEKGDHQGEHAAGNDLTDEIAAAPHEPDMLDAFPVVGEISG
ncbi:MAG: cytochrome B5 [Actinobacteria bacterium]|nr:cytochrome B5 [Actinomycetota bacterium]